MRTMASVLAAGVKASGMGSLVGRFEVAARLLHRGVPVYALQPDIVA